MCVSSTGSVTCAPAVSHPLLFFDIVLPPAAAVQMKCQPRFSLFLLAAAASTQRCSATVANHVANPNRNLTSRMRTPCTQHWTTRQRVHARGYRPLAVLSTTLYSLTVLSAMPRYATPRSARCHAPPLQQVGKENPMGLSGPHPRQMSMKLPSA